jgi:hypothetical protein
MVEFKNLFSGHINIALYKVLYQFNDDSKFEDENEYLLECYDDIQVVNTSEDEIKIIVTRQLENSPKKSFKIIVSYLVRHILRTNLKVRNIWKTMFYKRN